MLSLASLAALAAARPPLLTLRGGADASDIPRCVGAGCTLANAIHDYTFPKDVIARSGASSDDKPALITARSEGQWRAGLAIMLMADASDARALIALSHYICVVNLLGDVPANDAVGAPQAPIVVLAAVFAALGYATTRVEWFPLWLSPALAISNGLQFYVMPKQAWAMYSADGKGTSDLTLALTRRVGWAIVLRGIYTAAIILGVARKKAFGIVFAMAALDNILHALSGQASVMGMSPRSQALVIGFAALVAAASFV
mmetsp:Transcript_18379/g.37445  ORF Transcript_18379/g.37445 Transcript_18379/m.37445 type:complete len:258 (+) Transcript_18379:36-809(+)|eukprot:CAMPEP_0119063770 /NCGR_PEP_ID=MMETSP1178-20130426/7016_1 /TAXON_ID=33656 /ORGANISM="unid sp, Strain CCMP2000" /LENGTH=257 /DNA_ID=CAMNT_0007045153 /DNA_START=36 /DNA_END=809 /DNA_ORIENTATION=-